MCTICSALSLGDSLPQVSSPQASSASATSSNIAPTPGADGIGDSLYPGFGNGGYDAQSYQLDLNVTDVATSTLTGRTTIAAKATQSLSSFNLDFIGFTIGDITVNDQPATYSRDGQELTIVPTVPLAAGSDFTVEVNYSGAPEQITSQALPVLTGWVIYDGGNFVLSEPDGAANFYPVNDHPLDKANYSFRVTVPDDYEVAANGVLEQVTDNGGSTTYRFEARDRMASYLTTVNITSDFDLQIEPPAEGVPIRNYFDAGIDPELLEPFALQDEMMTCFTQLFGEYPFEVYGSVVMNTETGSALETQTLSIFGLDQLGRNPAVLGGFSASTEEIVAHELSHQWFGNSLALSDWQDIWLNESFATYSQGLWLEYSQGKAVLDQWVKNKYNTVVDGLAGLVPPGKPPADDLFNRGVYDWGALGLHALRLEIGDDAFFKTLQTYYSQYRDGNVTPADLIGVAEAVSGQELNAFFESWFYSETIPAIPELGLDSGPTGDQTLYGVSDAGTLFGRDGNDIIYGNITNVLVGGAGDDRLYGDSSTNTLLGGADNDTLYGNGGTDTLDGSTGDDLIYGGSEADTIRAGAGDDTIYAGGGADLITSGTGLDTIWLSGNPATITLSAGEGYDLIKGFQLGATKLSLSSEGLSFTDSPEGVKITQGDDLIAVVAWQSASTFTSNLDLIFVA
jgi:hypothetical protein